MKEAWQDAYEALLENPPLLIVRELLGDLSGAEIISIRQAVSENDKLEIGEVIYAAFERWAAKETMKAAEEHAEEDEMSCEDMGREESRYLDRINARDINRKVE